jgi:hypothetical protein
MKALLANTVGTVSRTDACVQLSMEGRSQMRSFRTVSFGVVLISAVLAACGGRGTSAVVPEPQRAVPRSLSDAPLCQPGAAKCWDLYPGDVVPVTVTASVNPCSDRYWQLLTKTELTKRGTGSFFPDFAPAKPALHCPPTSYAAAMIVYNDPTIPCCYGGGKTPFIYLDPSAPDAFEVAVSTSRLSGWSAADGAGSFFIHDPTPAPSASPTPSPPPPCGQMQNGGNLNTVAANDPSGLTKSLLNYFSNHNRPPTVVFDASPGQRVQPNGPPLFYALTTSATSQNTPDTIRWYGNNILVNGGDATEILAHELLHIWFDDIFIGPGSAGTASNMPRAFNQTFTGTATVTVNNTPITLTFSWTIARNDQNGYSIGKGYGAFEHLVIHNILINTYHHDTSGAIEEALDDPELQLSTARKAAILAAYKRSAVPVTGTYNMPPTNALCGAAGPAPRGRSVRSLDDPSMAPTFNLDYIVQ